ncbi:MAG: hypothetical protein LC101_01915 [Flavobacteriales bacterium]|nr:hypothetical protein [Flavobacteriales bacterium]MCZ2442525.1 hypothetical protein [Flavobacteriales bacterium]
MKFLFIYISLLVLGVISFTGCGSPDCIRCQNITGYANTVYCSDTYETTLLPNDPDWHEFTDEALNAGCTKEKHP